MALGLFAESPRSAFEKLIGEYKDKAIVQAIGAGRWDQLTPFEMGIALESAASHSVPDSIFTRRDEPVEKELSIYRGFWMLNPQTYGILKYNARNEMSMLDLMGRYWQPFSKIKDNDDTSIALLGLTDFSSASLRAAEVNVEIWNTTLNPWSDFVEAARRTWGESMPLFAIACIAAGIKSKHIRAAEYGDLLNHDFPLVERARYARLRNSSPWWMDQVSRAKSASERKWVLLVSICWAPASALFVIQSILVEFIDNLSASEFREMERSVGWVLSLSPGGKPKLNGYGHLDILASQSPRFSVTISNRLSHAQQRRIIESISDDSSVIDFGVISIVSDFLIITSYRDINAWGRAIKYIEDKGGADTISSHYDADISSMLYYGGRSGMSQEIANRIMAASDKFPFSVVEAASASLYRAPAISKSSIATVAEEESWFAH
ncbi:hypothetical protein EWE75_14470 [Sphingomonas populi]|uniref:Uncharacterized protein n=1 Tax=Sphingomonas populi TaxID=2484750 RepID=A0A4Q6Y0Y1_9SPHN|nr:hypothetical protein [Sphingomonas populi]RZF63832.1 hypothetical protein EWE75_14470 [Sphingomonas populi]